MLQQTRVAAVIPYYERFLSKFPTVRRLARARTSSVLAAWAGLGYYSRARNLHRAAREIVARHGGAFPREREAALKLPGIGRYTVAAILSIAYGETFAALDGNVARVLARLLAVRSDVREPRTRRRLEQAADALLACEAPGDWNEAMMELGATICTPVSPRCEPVSGATLVPGVFTRHRGKIAAGAAQSRSLANHSGRRRAARPTRAHADGAAAEWRRRNLLAHVAIPRRRNKWRRAQGVARSPLAHRLVRICAGGRRPESALQPLAPARHTVTFRNIRLLPFLLRVPSLPSVQGAQKPLLASLGRLPVSNATRKIAQAALRAL